MNDSRTRKRRTWVWAVYTAMGILTVVATGGALVLYRMAGVFIYDANLEVFQRVLQPEQREGIIWSARQLMIPVVAALVITNVGWLVAVGVALLRYRKDSD